VFEPRVGQDGKDVVWVPTPYELANKMLEIAKVTPDDFVIDLGSGDGRIVIAAAKLGARALGIEYNQDMIELSRKNATKEGVSAKAKFVKADIFEYDFSEATVITMFLLSEINLKLRPKLLNLKPGTRIVSNTFTMDDWEPDFEVTIDVFSGSDYEEDWNSWTNAFLWIIPAKVDGKWKFQQGELAIHQEFQTIYGTYKADNKTSDITSGKLNGDTITFSMDGKKYSGLVNEKKTMKGTVIYGNTKEDWNATYTQAK
jgi:SAM-dependent methyltransferase